MTLVDKYINRVVAQAMESTCSIIYQGGENRRERERERGREGEREREREREREIMEKEREK